MQGQKVHEYAVETGPMGLPVARLSKVHNLVTFISNGQQKIHYLDGRFVDDGGNALDEDQIPEHIKQQALSIPFTADVSFDPDVLRRCEFCSYEGPSREYAVHLADVHIRKASIPQPAEFVEVAPTAPRVRPEQLPQGNYETDAEGFVVLKADGTPKRRRGRPTER